MTTIEIVCAMPKRWWWEQKLPFLVWRVPKLAIGIVCRPQSSSSSSHLYVPHLFVACCCFSCAGSLFDLFKIEIICFVASLHSLKKTFFLVGRFLICYKLATLNIKLRSLTQGHHSWFQSLPDSLLHNLTEIPNIARRAAHADK